MFTLIEQHSGVYGQDLKKTNHTLNTTASIRNDSADYSDNDNDTYVGHQEHAGRQRAKVFMVKNKNAIGKKLKKKVYSQGLINNNNNNNGLAERFFFPKIGQMQRGAADKKVFGFITKPSIGTGIGGANQKAGEIAIGMPRNVKHLNIEIVRRPGRGRGKGGGTGGGGTGGGVRGTTPLPNSPEYPEYPAYDNPGPTPGPAPGPGPAPAPAPGGTDYGSYGADGAGVNDYGGGAGGGVLRRLPAPPRIV